VCICWVCIWSPIAKIEKNGGKNPLPSVVAIVTKDLPHLANYRVASKGERMCAYVRVC